MTTLSNLYNYYRPGGGEEAVLRSNLQAMGNKPHAQEALATLNRVAADGYNAAVDRSPVISSFMSGLGRHLGTLQPNQRYAEFKSAIQGIDAKGEVSPLINAFDRAPENVRTALMNAVTHNPHFVQHIMKDGTGSIASLLTPQTLTNSNYSGPIADVLNTIARNNGAPPPAGNGYDFKNLDALGVNAKNFFDAEKALREATKPGQPALTAEQRKALDDRLSLTQRSLFDSVRSAGGNVPAMANFNFGMLGQFFKDLFGEGGVNGAISNLAKNLGMQGQQLQDFQQLLQPAAGLMKFMGQDYYEYFAHYGPRMAASGQSTYQTINNLMQGERIQFQAPATGNEPSRRVGEPGGDVSTAQRLAAGNSTATPSAEQAVVPPPRMPVMNQYAAPAPAGPQ